MSEAHPYRHLTRRRSLTLLALVLAVWLVLPGSALAWTGTLHDARYNIPFAEQDTYHLALRKSWPGSSTGTDYEVGGTRGYKVYFCRAAAQRGFPTGWLNQSFGVPFDEFYKGPTGTGPAVWRSGALENEALDSAPGHWLADWDNFFNAKKDASLFCDSWKTGTPGKYSAIWAKHVADGRHTFGNDTDLDTGPGENYGSGNVWGIDVKGDEGQWIDWVDLDAEFATYMTAGGGPAAGSWPNPTTGHMVPHAGIWAGRVSSGGGSIGYDVMNCYGNGAWTDAPWSFWGVKDAGSPQPRGAAWDTNSADGLYYQSGGPYFFMHAPGTLATNPSDLPDARCRTGSPWNGVGAPPTPTRFDFPNAGGNKARGFFVGTGCNGDGALGQSKPTHICRGDGRDRPAGVFETTVDHPLDEPNESAFNGHKSNQTRANAQNPDNWEAVIRSAQFYIRDDQAPSAVDVHDPSGTDNYEINDVEFFDWSGGQDRSGLRKVEFWIDGTAAGPRPDARSAAARFLWPRGDANPCPRMVSASATHDIDDWWSCDTRSDYQVRVLDRFCDHTVTQPCPGSDAGLHGFAAAMNHPALATFVGKTRGDFRFDVDMLSSGTHTAYIRVTDAAGNQSVGSESFDVNPICTTSCPELTQECVQGSGDRDCEEGPTSDPVPNPVDDPIVDPLATPSSTDQCQFVAGQGFVDSSGEFCLFSYTLAENDKPTRRPLDAADCNVRDQVIGSGGAIDPITDPQTNQVVTVTVHLNAFSRDGGAVGEQAGRTSVDVPTRSNVRYRKALGCDT